MIFYATVTVQNGQTEVDYVSGTPWANLLLPAFFQLDPSAGPVDPSKYWIADVDFAQGQTLNLAQPWPGVSATVAAMIFSDFTPVMNLPLANPGDVNIADLWNRAMRILDALTSVVPIHGATHVGGSNPGVDPVPLATTLFSGLLCQLSGNATDYVGGDNQCHALAGVPTGSVMLWAGLTTPTNWLICDGTLYSRTTYANLYAALGGSLSPWGQGDGHTTFASPDLRGRVPMGAGTGKGLSARAVGQIFGEETHLTVLNEMPVHAHVYTYDNLQPSGGTLGFTSNGTYKLINAQQLNTQNAGNGVAHNNIQPSAVINFIIRT